MAKRPRDSGVVYCLSRKDCETVSGKLQDKLQEMGHGNVRISFYHAELDANERNRRHHAWSSGHISVLCATIAFGMGIDKPDVRYVIHYSMPKSITHYYQESGRAGRDGGKADCILYYSYKDKQVLEGMIVKSASNPGSQSVRRKIDQLYSCVRYCENDFICRRTMQLEFFGEQFERSKCGKTCDNCRAGREAERRDLTQMARDILELLSDMGKQRNGRGVTLVQLVEIFRGSKSKSATKFLQPSKLSGYGKGSQYQKSEVDRILHAMVFDKILLEVSEANGLGFHSDYVQQGERAMAIQRGEESFFVNFPRKGSRISTNITKASEHQNSTKKKSRQTPSKNKGKPKIQAFDVLMGSEALDHEEDYGKRTKAQGEKNVLPKKYTEELMNRIKRLVSMWADEEQMNGNKVFYWNIMSNSAMMTFASQVPTSMEELTELGILGENVVKEYGERLVKSINSFIQMENLQQYIDRRSPKRLREALSVFEAPAPSTKKAKGTDPKNVVDIDLDFGIDFSSQTSGNQKMSAAPNPNGSSSYFDTSR
eukprot:CAMPEP_0118677586 /NCGR_PEP_ID=MMETSP0800-20121206/2713_1 /TAXON_ID=210618 ORGANISM="Striatella unipunctata, Strain CCMP2910" /NCGR_SAMPLE_ID=MMETSP0800 /ASSEMBLY_ACC=CAM_ASM_000638 /LENGTH=539 /DNA_ID=CAMNT_0006573283 /DNA_START=376 /DNA_END=1995 /DNA_ORIENTATION=-